MKKKKGLSWWSINKFLILGDPIIIINMITIMVHDVHDGTRYMMYLMFS